jgi:23S rRNA pseudouridine1911/1915/1917 synthase
MPPAPEAGFELLYEEGPCLAVSKPPGVLTQAPPGIDSLETRIKTFLAHRGGSPEVYLGVPHRLDRPASGAMVFALTPRATRRLAAQFEARKVTKTYWACVSGRADPSQGTWTDFVRKIPGRPKAEIVDSDHPEARQAILHYRTLDTRPWGSWLEIELETGRMHQVRIQAASRGLPVLGDFEYGATIPFGPQYDDVRLRAIGLHARTLSFRNPGTHQLVAVAAPLPDSWRLLGIEG